jgi:hypothetical protein
MIKQVVTSLACLAFPVLAAAQQWSGDGGTTLPIFRSGKVGIGGSLNTGNIVTPLEIEGSVTNASAKFGSFEIQGFALNNAWMGENVYYNGGFQRRTTGAGTLLYFYDGSFAVRSFPSGPTGAVSPTQRFIILSDGTIGFGGSQLLGTSAGAQMLLSPAGNVTMTGDLSVSGNVAAKYQDVAEWVPAKEDLAPGTVVVLDTTTANRVMASSSAYDATVAGVVSSKPGLILGDHGANKEQIATTGRVKVRVDASSHAVAIGDLLVTSGKAGYAMRSEPMEINGRKFHQPGTIIGKALESLPNGDGEILVLLSLQ